MIYGKSGWSSVKDNSPVLKISTGEVRGFCRNGNAVFLGIPYGDACDGAGRFKAPQPAKDWDGVRDCTHYGPIAMQDKTDLNLLPDAVRRIMQEYADVFTGGVPFDRDAEVPSENCLVLNVVSPGLDQKKRPVLVYIHGGGYMSGSGGVTAAICDRLADEEDLVIVTVNHRLNAFGALYLGAFDEEYRESGIVTQIDLLLALHWIKENISVFGGDPDAVTLIGESGGGMKIHHLLAMPESRDLFARAIIMSGSIPAAAKTPEEGTAETLEVLRRLGISREDWRRVLTVPAEELLAATRGLELIQADATPFMPTADGVRMPLNTSGNFCVCEETADIPVIIGSSEEELASNVLDPTLTWDGLRDMLLRKENHLLSTLKGLTEENVDEVITAFRVHCGDRKAPWQIGAQIISTAHFLGGGSYQAAAVRAKAGAPVWHYTTTFDTPVPGVPGFACAWHTADLPLAFRAVWHKDAEGLSKDIAHRFAAFARTGDPSAGTLAWPAFKQADKQTLLFDTACEVQSDPYADLVAVMEKIAWNV